MAKIGPSKEKQGNEFGAGTVYGEALQVIQEAVRLKPDEAVYHSYLSNAHRRLGDILLRQDEVGPAMDAYALAAQALHQATILDRTNPAYWNQLSLLQYGVGLAKDKQGDKPGAQSVYTELCTRYKKQRD